MDLTLPPPGVFTSAVSSTSSVGVGAAVHLQHPDLSAPHLLSEILLFQRLTKAQDRQ